MVSFVFLFGECLWVINVEAHAARFRMAKHNKIILIRLSRRKWVQKGARLRALGSFVALDYLGFLLSGPKDCVMSHQR